MSLPRLSSEEWDKLTWQLCELLYVKAIDDTMHEREQSGYSSQEFKPYLHKRDVERFKKRLNELIMWGLIQAKEDAHGQKRYVFDLYQLNRYQERDDVMPVFERLNGVYPADEPKRDWDAYSWKR